jgi:hypothetical protein
MAPNADSPRSGPPRAHLRDAAGTILVVAVAVSAFTFLATDDRKQRLRAGISDECAQAQYGMRLIPMRPGCMTFDEFLDVHQRTGEGPPPKGDDERHALSPERAEETDGACGPSAESGSKAEGTTSGPDYVYRLLQKFDCQR